MRFMETPDTPAESAPEPAAAPAAGSAPAPTSIAAQDWSKAAAAPEYRAAVVDLLGALAYAELAAFERL
ncbi:ferritin-like fold-containing protein, partial [Streptomyces sp. NPDC005918]|uniref:ferritin-like fold-containing protein n=1 Tax=Streptomyces sp. NPDC005918 TaxID=3155454 RepID=UPI0033F655EB